MRRIEVIRQLAYHDCVQVFEATDAIGGRYLGLLTEVGNEADRYLVVGLSPESVRRLKVGELHLREAIEGRELPEWFEVESVVAVGVQLDLVEMEGRLPEVCLPAPGVFLSLDLDPAPVVKESAARKNAVLEIWVDPPEAGLESKIRAETLAALLNCIQSLVRHSYRKAVSLMSPLARKGINTKDAPLLDAFAFMPGSCRVLFEAAQQPDLFQHSEIRRGLEKLDEVTEFSAQPEKALEVMKQNQGHFAAAYIRLLDFLILTRTGVSYRWASPDVLGSRGGQITQREAGPLLEAFRKAETLSIETVRIRGMLIMANSGNQTWTLKDQEDGSEHHGSVKEGCVGVSKLTIDTVYTFECEEKLEEQPATGREIRTLLLQSYHE